MIIVKGRGNRRKIVHEMVPAVVVNRADKPEQDAYKILLCDILGIKMEAAE